MKFTCGMSGHGDKVSLLYGKCFSGVVNQGDLYGWVEWHNIAQNVMYVAVLWACLEHFPA